jgi:hypothetical protein
LIVVLPRMNLIVSVEEAREILGQSANKMTDEEIIELVQNLDAIAVCALRDATQKRKDDALALANVVYDVYQDKKAADRKNLS